MALIGEIAVFLMAAVVAVPLFRFLGLGSVLGYLAAGLAIGPWGLGLAHDPEAILHFGEIGIVFLLFVIGLELRPARLRALRRSVFGLGLAQVVVTGTAISAVAWTLGVPAGGAWVVGFGLSLSSTAFVLQLLAERRELTSAHGRAAFSVLLFQDLAVIPMLALVPVFAGGFSVPDDSIWLDLMYAATAVAGLVVGGHYLLRPLLRAAAAEGNYEVFTAATLLIVLGSALLMEWVGLSLGLGAFLAGVLVADSEYRHQMEADIEPFKGLLLGLFFMGVGMSANPGILVSRPELVVGGAVALMTGKTLLTLGLARSLGHSGKEAVRLSLILCQGGEFAFVLFAAALNRGLLEEALVDPLIMAVTLSMALTPVLVWAGERLLVPRLDGTGERPFDTIDDPPAPVIIAGFGRFGQIVGRLLSSLDIRFTALEISASQVDFVRRYGGKLYFGDASHRQLLQAAHADKAGIFVIAVDDMEASIRIAETVRQHFPGLKILARARNRSHAHRLMDAGAHYVVREVLHSSLSLGEQVLKSLGFEDSVAEKVVSIFERVDEDTLKRQQAVRHEEKALMQTAEEASEELRHLFETDADTRKQYRRSVELD